MITYELALKLKEAGFPYIPFLKRENYLEKEEYIGEDPIILIPTLSELIDNCLSPIQLNSFPIGNVNDETSGKIMYIACYPSLKNQPKAEGNSFEEAVANLWLATNNKD